MTFESIIKKDNFSFKISGLYLVTDRSLCLYHTLEEIVTLSVAGGVKIVQLREKQLSTKDFLKLALTVKSLLKDTGIPLIINDRVDIAFSARADGVHLGQSDLPVSYARQILGDHALIGLSVESMEDFLSIPTSVRLDYLGVSPIFKTKSKTDLKSTWEIDGLKKLKQLTKLPLVAIGGINESNAKEVISVGANSVAVVSYLCSAKDPKANAKTLANMFI